MKWFKHFTDNHRGRSVQKLMDEMGHAGLAIYILMEICAEKISKSSDREFADSDFVFSFHPRVLDNALRMKRKSTENILRISQECNLLKFDSSENEIKISMPILLDLLEYDQKKFRQRRATVPPQKRLDKIRIETDTETDTELQKTKKSDLVLLRSPKAPAPEGTQTLIAHYCELWKAKYGAQAPITGKASGCFKTLVKDHGLEKATKYVDAYLQMQDQFFVTKRHDVSTLLANLNAVAQFAETGKIISRREANKIDSNNNFQNTLAMIDRGEI